MQNEPIVEQKHLNESHYGKLCLCPPGDGI